MISKPIPHPIAGRAITAMNVATIPSITVRLTPIVENKILVICPTNEIKGLATVFTRSGLGTGGTGTSELVNP